MKRSNIMIACYLLSDLNMIDDLLSAGFVESPQVEAAGVSTALRGSSWSMKRSVETA